MEQPKKEYEGKTYFEIGCRKCADGGKWKIYSDGKEMIAECVCGNTVKIPTAILTKEPEVRVYKLSSMI